jgi:methyltransferase (TIGR00027 family)
LVEDHIAARLLSPNEVSAFDASILTSVRRGGAAVAPDGEQRAITAYLHGGSASAPLVLVRAWWAEELLRSAVARGATRYFVVAAGLDSFAVRRPAWANGLDIVEIDHPITQADKRRRLANAGLALAEPAYVAVDLTTDELSSRLETFGSCERVFASMNGITYYLSPHDVRQNLVALRRAASQVCEIAVDYWDSAYAAPDRRTPAVESLFRSLERNGEPARTTFAVEELAELASEAGFGIVDDCSAETVAREAAAQGHDRVLPPAMARLALLRSCHG